jgi:hypothetical protein
MKRRSTGTPPRRKPAINPRTVTASETGMAIPKLLSRSIMVRLSLASSVRSYSACSSTKGKSEIP